MCPIPFRTSIRLRFPCIYNNPKFPNSTLNVVTHVCKTLYTSSDHTTLHFNSPIFNTIITTSITYYDGFCFHSQNYERCSDEKLRRARSSAIQDRFNGTCSARWRGPGQERLYRHQLRRCVCCPSPIPKSSTVRFPNLPSDIGASG